MEGKTLLQRRENWLGHGSKLGLDNNADNFKVSDALKIVEVKPGTNSLVTAEQVRDFFRRLRRNTFCIGKRDKTQQGCCEGNGSVNGCHEHVNVRKFSGIQPFKFSVVLSARLSKQQ